jgi:hypothetical protein
MQDSSESRGGADSGSSGHIRVRSWEEFKAWSSRKASSLVYVMEQNGLHPTKETTILRLIMLSDQEY